MNKKNFKTLIIMCWVLLAVCVVIKLFGGNWFELSTDNTKFIDFCAFVDNTMWIKMILALIICLTSNYLFICLLLNKEKLNKKDIIIYGSLMTIKSLTGWFISWLPFIIDVIALLLIPLITKRFKNWKRVVVVNVLVVLFQVISVIIRNVGFMFIGNSFIEQILIQIDYYVLLVIYYLYNVKYFIRKEK